MFDDEIQTSRDNERFSQKREQVIETINRHILETSISQVLEVEINAQTSLIDLLGSTCLYIINNHPEYRKIASVEAHQLLEALRAGMAFACWTHNAEDDPAVKESIVHSLEYTAYHMRYAGHDDTEDSTMYARYESAMEHVDARDAFDDAIEQERALVEHCAHNFGARTEIVRDAFKHGYGFIRRAVTLPYGDTPERYIYNLDTLGMNKKVQETFIAYCNDDMVFETDNIDTFYTRRTEALRKFRNDPFITRHFKEGQQFSFIGGICKIIGTGEPESRITKYHSLNQGEGFVIHGTFKGFSAGSSLNEEGVQRVHSEQFVNINDIIEPVPTAIQLQLTDVTIQLGANEIADETDYQPLKQMVSIPLHLGNQQLLYRK